MKTSAQEECGVWLDTLQLKGKAKQKQPARPISKLLNPFAKGGGYSLAVALNFTQTEMKMPKTKQSSISTFFTSHRRVLKKMATQSCSSTSTAPTNISSGTKRRYESDVEKSDVYKSEPRLDHDWFSKNMYGSQQVAWEKYEEESPTPSEDLLFEPKEEQYEEINPPASKKRFTECSLVADDSQPPPQAWSQDPLFTCSQYPNSECFLSNQKTQAAKTFNSSEPSEETFGFHLDLEGKTSTQKSLKYFKMDDDKENSTTLSPNSHVDPISNHKWIPPKTASPSKHCRDQLWKQSDKEKSYNSQLKWNKPKSSPLKKQALEQQSRDAYEDNLAMLFTQDSEGFRVIAHRGLQTRSPLKDQTNVSTGIVKNAVYKSQVEEDEDEMLFTQDSQGNMVIKH
ncbi:aurora kinase A and ninein-interacting protein [Betta splendens]|uniref:Aurora kinase A and ninein-interacting protein n=1 Tax=Betta splendens TaxID=158456 RepID=A0A6P7NSG1_BETSP|nr:aurora kinase A and ninein-interacting protein [Betta splendens]